ncbi:hypothetical protein Tco_0918342, partial [Tanacetum coccineum]
MLKKFDLASVKTAITPMETKMALTKDEEVDEVDVHLYRSMIGSLMYVLVLVFRLYLDCMKDWSMTEVVQKLILKPEESAGFAEIVDFLKGSHIRYALTYNPTIHDSLVKQFWQTATASTLADGTLELRATIDTLEYTITEAYVRSKL